MKRILNFSILLSFLIGSYSNAQKVFHDCGMEGNATSESVKALNREKNRYTFPTIDNMDTTITLHDMLAEGSDEHRFTSTTAVQVIGYVVGVKKGTIESCNCKSKRDEDRDTHIEIVGNPSETRAARRVIAEVTPRLRAIMKGKGIDWTLVGLREKFLHKWVKIEGWLFFDAEQVASSFNTNPDGDNIWRATAWEIHPITGINLVSQSQ